MVQKPDFIILQWMALLALGGCARDPLPDVCPDVFPEELAITEIQGNQSGDDTNVQWIEIANVSGRDLDLLATGIRVQQRTGDPDELKLLVRTSVHLAAGAYAVLGSAPAGIPASYMTYNFAGELARSLFKNAAMDLVSCGSLVDRIYYNDLPAAGTLALDGNTEPSAAANDAPQAWCTRITGSPGERNPACAAP